MKILIVEDEKKTGEYLTKGLTEAGFVTRSKRGTWAYYKLVPGALDALSRLLVTA